MLAEPFLALRGDRFILRDETAQRTIGGGVGRLARRAEAQAERPVAVGDGSRPSTAGDDARARREPGATSADEFAVALARLALSC